MRIVDFYNVRPDELKPGDVLVCTVTLHVVNRLDDNEKPMYRVYRCGYPPQTSGGIPQGANLFGSQRAVAEGLFPVVAGMNPD